MTNEENVIRSVFSSYINDLKAYSTKPNRPMFKMLEDVRDKAIKALETTCIEDYPTCTECEHYDSEKHYCPRFCQVIKDALAEAQPCEDAVSREAVKELVVKEFVNPQDGMEEWRNAVNDVVEEILHNIETMPSVTPTNEDIKEAYLKGYDYGVKDWFKSKTQPCEDCISREKTLKAFAEKCGGECGCCKYNGSGYDTAENCKLIKSMPSVTPQRPKGKWIEVFVETPNDPYSYGFKSHKCSKCEYSPLQISNYCPNCGAKMSGGDEDEDGKSL